MLSAQAEISRAALGVGTLKGAGQFHGGTAPLAAGLDGAIAGPAVWTGAWLGCCRGRRRRRRGSMGSFKNSPTFGFADHLQVMAEPASPPTSRAPGRAIPTCAHTRGYIRTQSPSRARFGVCPSRASGSIRLRAAARSAAVSDEATSPFGSSSRTCAIAGRE